MPFVHSKKASSTPPGSLSKDVALPADAEDTISSVSWSPVTDHLAAASWDGKVRIYEVGVTGASKGVAMFATDGPVLSCDWAKDGSKIVAGGADKKVHLFDTKTSQKATFGQHNAPVRSVRFLQVPASNSPIVASGSWDATVKYWDLRQQNPLASIVCKDRVYSMDAKADLLVIATAELHIHLIDLKSPTTILETIPSQLKYQTKVVSVFPDGKGWATASIEGRCGMRSFKEDTTDKVAFTFRCHREAESVSVSKVFTVNDVSFHPVHHTVFSTAGSDGVYQFWDRAARSKLKAYAKSSAPITTTAYNRDGRYFAYAVGYDWSRGYAANNKGIETKLMLHPICEEDVMKN